MGGFGGCIEGEKGMAETLKHIMFLKIMYPLLNKK